MEPKIDPKSIAKNTPSDDDSAFKKAGGQSADASAGASHNVQLHFHGLQHHDTSQLASLVGKELENVLGSRSHDIDHTWGSCHYEAEGRPPAGGSRRFTSDITPRAASSPYEALPHAWE